MHLPDAVLRVAALAPGKRMTVMHAGVAYTLPVEPEPAPVVLPDPLEIVSQRLLEAVSAGQEQVAASIAELSGTLHLPVQPIYGSDGKLIGAKRVSKLKDQP